MNLGNNRLKIFIEKFYPANPFVFSFSLFRILLLLITLGITVTILFLRQQNKDELEILQTKHQEIQLMISRYLREMSFSDLDSATHSFMEKKLNDYRGELKILDKNIKQIKIVWFMK